MPADRDGVLRIIGHHKYLNTPGPPSIVADIVRKLRQAPGHVFWGDTISLLDEVYTDVSQLLTSSQVTDSYFLSLAASQAGKLATLDRRMSDKATKAGLAALHLISAKE